VFTEIDGSQVKWDEVSFSISIKEAGPAVIKGDVNGDGEVNVADLVAVSNYMAGDDTVSKEKADVNSDGEVNVADLVAISNIMSGNAE
jgi:stress response protein YsnF